MEHTSDYLPFTHFMETFADDWFFLFFLYWQFVSLFMCLPTDINAVNVVMSVLYASDIRSKQSYKWFQDVLRRRTDDPPPSTVHAVLCVLLYVTFLPPRGSSRMQLILSEAGEWSRREVECWGGCRWGSGGVGRLCGCISEAGNNVKRRAVVG